MFPLYENTVICLALTAIAGAVSIYSVLASGTSRLIGVAVALIAFAYVFTAVVLWSMSGYARSFGNPYEIYLIFVYGSLGAGAVIVGAVWGWLSRWFVAGNSALVLAALPLLATAVYLLERQRVPDAPCAERALFEIGDLTVAMPRTVWTSSRWAEGTPAQKWYGDYGDWLGAKPSVRALCLASNGGRETVRLYHLWITSRLSGHHREENCGSGSVQEDLRAYCAAAARTQLTVVQLYARPDGRASPSSSQFDEERINRALVAGERAGIRCNESLPDPERGRYCSIWFDLTPDVQVVSSARLGPPVDNEDPVADAIVVLQELMSTLTPD